MLWYNVLCLGITAEEARDMKKLLAAALVCALGAGSAFAGEEIRAVLLHLGYNMWCEWLPEEVMAKAKLEADKLPDLKLRFEEASWRRLTAHMTARKLNTVVIDVAEGLRYPSHPELKVAGTDETRWVILGASGEYGVGTFDGSKFVAEESAVKAPWNHKLSGNRVFYAAQTFTGDPKGRTVWLPWMKLKTDDNVNFNRVSASRWRSR